MARAQPPKAARSKTTDADRPPRAEAAMGKGIPAPPPILPQPRRRPPPLAWACLAVALALALASLVWVLQPLGIILAAAFTLPAAGIFLYEAGRGWQIRSGLAWAWRGTAAWAVGAVAGLAVLVLANHAIDHHGPDEAGAETALVLTIGLVAAAVAWGAVLARPPRGHWLSLAWAAAVGVILLFPAMLIATDYGKEYHALLAGFSQQLGFALLASGAVAAGLAAGVAWTASRRMAGAVVASYALGAAVAAAAAAAWMLVTLPEQAAKASKANEAPGVAVAALAVVLLCAVIARRRRLR